MSNSKMTEKLKITMIYKNNHNNNLQQQIKNLLSK